MKLIFTRFIVVFFMGLYTPTIMAVPVVAIDLDSGTAGIQSSLSVLTGTVLSASLVAYDDGTAPSPVLIGAVGTDIISSSSGVASLGLVATAGGFADLLANAVDIFSPPPPSPLVAVVSGTALTPFFLATPAALGSVGYLDFSFVAAGALLPVGMASFIDLINFSITAGSVGSSIISSDAGSLSGVFPGFLDFPFSATAELTVTSAGGGGGNNIPEPSILLLMMLGWLGFSSRRFFSATKS